MLTMNILMNSRMKLETCDIYFIDSFLKSLQERFSKHKFILVGFLSLLPTDLSPLADQILKTLIHWFCSNKMI